MLLSPGRLNAALHSAVPPVVLDVRWALGDLDGHRHYLDAHIPGAVFVDLDTELAAHGEPEDGRHPLPIVETLQAAARRWGVRTGIPVVVYDNTGNLAAARAWWLLTWAGVADVTLLDGGLSAWIGEGNDTVSGEQTPSEPGDIVLTGGHLPTMTADDAAVQPDSGTLIDARAAERYSGAAEPIDPRAGHIPGAVSLPTACNLDSDGTFLPAEVLRDRFSEVGDDVAVYCGSGITAAHEIFALKLAGIDAALYPGSWSQWSSDPARPVATGTSPR
ncbi:sulfurtransferase [Rhodococcus sp. 06-462-5]|uniref:sulfurtransferase n=1 Tax=Nocardiaceae TaxID=85025 RepID=UPI00050C4730|nr:MULTISPECIES: sulfurtransferase [Rhodococcus]OZC74124.1 sulfurtransferase [Rhodococcus sp. 06-462-5]OZE68185.1 sulfurtransferase [Rhodococcus sp. 02-925g]OZF51499.1 sulfurtransferase [Rhodococcus sp. 14-1411-2a]